MYKKVEFYCELYFLENNDSAGGVAFRKIRRQTVQIAWNARSKVWTSSSIVWILEKKKKKISSSYFFRRKTRLQTVTALVSSLN